MKENKMNRSVRLIVRVTPAEASDIKSRFAKSTCRKLSDYHRKVLLHKPVTVNQRNQSLDDFMEEMILLRSELSSLGNNFNQAVKRLHTLEKIEEYKSWLLLYETSRKILLQKVEAIKYKIAQINDQWLQ